MEAGGKERRREGGREGERKGGRDSEEKRVRECFSHIHKPYMYIHPSFLPSSLPPSQPTQYNDSNVTGHNINCEYGNSEEKQVEVAVVPAGHTVANLEREGGGEGGREGGREGGGGEEEREGGGREEGERGGGGGGGRIRWRERERERERRPTRR